MTIRLIRDAELQLQSDMEVLTTYVEGMPLHIRIREYGEWEALLGLPQGRFKGFGGMELTTTDRIIQQVKAWVDKNTI